MFLQGDNEALVEVPSFGLAKQLREKGKDWRCHPLSYSDLDTEYHVVKIISVHPAVAAYGNIEKPVSEQLKENPDDPLRLEAAFDKKFATSADPPEAQSTGGR